jgi:murein DD-endopeptidase MepM/ murein hydrolase activator NlpD
MKLLYPIDEGLYIISQVFGVNPKWYPASKGHPGIDFALPVGKNIYAMQDGLVIRADALQGKTGYGRHVRIQHAEGISIYGHFSVLKVKVGDTVTAGQVIGLSGGATTDPASGNSSGPHLHAEYRLTTGAPAVPGSYSGGAIDLIPYLVSRKYAGADVPVLYHLQTIYNDIVVRAGASQSSMALRSTGYAKLSVYEERKSLFDKYTWGRISPFLSEWVALDPNFYVSDKPTEVPTDETVVNLENLDSRLKKLEELAKANGWM